MPSTDKKQVFFVHCRPMVYKKDYRGYAATRGVTFAVKYCGKLIGFKVAAAHCSKKDNFNRKLGRQIAESRLASTGWWKAKGLSSVIDAMVDVCGKNGYVLPAASLVYIEETFNGQREGGGKGHTR